jgi:hypothetical protein
LSIVKCGAYEKVAEEEDNEGGEVVVVVPSLDTAIATTVDEEEAGLGGGGATQVTVVSDSQIARTLDSPKMQESNGVFKKLSP